MGRTGLPRELWRNKQTVSGRLGVTFVVDRATIASAQVDAVEESGYLAKPYRFIPLFAPGVGASVPPGASVAEVNAARADPRVSEQVRTAAVASRFPAGWLTGFRRRPSAWTSDSTPIAGVFSGPPATSDFPSTRAAA